MKSAKFCSVVAALVLAPLAMAGCTYPAEDETGACGIGDAETQYGRKLCVYWDPVLIEEGYKCVPDDRDCVGATFPCPPGYAHHHHFNGGLACTADSLEVILDGSGQIVLDGGSGCAGGASECACQRYGGQYRCFENEIGALCEDIDDPICTCYCVTGDAKPKCVNDSDCPLDSLCVDGQCSSGSGPIRYVAIEDLQSAHAVDYPGVDLDAVQLVKADGAIVGAVAVEDFENLALEGNMAPDPTAVLGAPDAYCDAANDDRFYAMGGLGSWVMLSYGDELIEPGDFIDVVELGATECGQYDDDDYAIGIGISVTGELGQFIEIASCSGSCMALVPAL